MPNISNQEKSHQDMRHREDSGKEHLTKDGEPDHRYKENREDQGNNKQQQQQQQQQSNKSDDYEDDDETSKLDDIPTKNDGTADMRYTESREAVASGLIDKDEVIEDALNGGGHHNDQQDSHQKKNGSDDKRSKGNRQDQDEE